MSRSAEDGDEPHQMTTLTSVQNKHVEMMGAGLRHLASSQVHRCLQNYRRRCTRMATVIYTTTSCRRNVVIAIGDAPRYNALAVYRSADNRHLTIGQLSADCRLIQKVTKT